MSRQLGELRKAGVKMRVPRQPLKLLEILLERPGKVFTQGGIAKARLAYKKESFGDFDQAVNVASRSSRVR
jgi:hypothetical protein